MNTKDRILELADKGIQQKLDLAMAAERERLANDKRAIEKALEMIEKRLVYKVVKTQYGNKERYVLATEEVFFKDYLKKPEYNWNRGLRFTEAQENSLDYIYKGVFSVNGERYFDMRYLLQEYAKDVEESITLYSYQLEKLRDMKEKYEKLVNCWENVKKLAEEWNNMQRDGRDG